MKLFVIFACENFQQKKSSHVINHCAYIVGFLPARALFSVRLPKFAPSHFFFLHLMKFLWEKEMFKAATFISLCESHYENLY